MKNKKYFFNFSTMLFVLIIGLFFSSCSGKNLSDVISNNDDWDLLGGGGGNRP